MPTITLEELKARIEERYEPTSIPLPDGRTVVLTQPLRLSKEQRAELRRVIATNNEGVKKAEHAQKMRDQANEQREKDGQPRVELTDEEQEQLNNEAEERTKAYLQSILVLAATDRSAAETLVAQVSDDLLLLGEIVSHYMKAGQAGEASPSPS